MSSKIPEDLKYSKSHEWIRLSGDAAVVGITDHAQQELTDIVFVEPPKVGVQIKAGEPCAVVESVKAASDLYAPVSGEITEINPAVETDPSLLNTQPYEDGWIFKVKLSDPGEAEKMMSAADYQAMVG